MVKRDMQLSIIGQGQDRREGNCMLSLLAYLREVVTFLLKAQLFFSIIPLELCFCTSHPFNSASIVESLHLSTSVVEDPILFSNPVWESAHLFMTCLDLRMSMLSVESRSNVYVLDYGLILAMEWLSRNSTILEYEKRVVRLLTCLGNALEVQCNPQGSAMLSYIESLDIFIDPLEQCSPLRRMVHFAYA